MMKGLVERAAAKTRKQDGPAVTDDDDDVGDDDSSLIDRGVRVIESLLEPSSEVFKLLTGSQKKGLRELKNMLDTGGVDKKAYIPQGLLNATQAEVDKQSTATSASKEGIITDSTNAYLVDSFGGVRPPPKQFLKTLLHANIFLSRVQNMAAASAEDSKMDGSAKHSIKEQIRRKESKFSVPPQQWLDLPPESKLRLAEMLSWTNISKWDYPIFELDKLTDGHPLLFLGWAIFASPHAQQVMQDQTMSLSETTDADPTSSEGDTAKKGGYRFLETFRIDPQALLEFLLLMEGEYQTCPYHNKLHAADCTQSLHVLLQMGGRSYSAEPLDILAVLLSAVVHDLGHPGLNNNFHSQSKSDIAITYNDRSILENMHLARTFEFLIGKAKDERFNILKSFPEDQIMTLRKKMIDSVLHTDMTTHFSKMAEIKGLAKILQDNMSKGSGGVEQALLLLTEEQKWQVLASLLHMADISNPAKHDPYFHQWADLCLEEFFQQGDRERDMGLVVSPLCCRKTTDRAGSQVGFIKFVILPAFELTAKVVPKVGEEILPQIKKNLDYWTKEAEREAMAKKEAEQEGQRGETQNGANDKAAGAKDTSQ